MGDRLFADRLRPLRALRVPHRQDELEDRQGDGRQEDGGPALAQVQRDGGGELRPAAAARRRHLQELRGSFAHCIPGRQWCRHAWQDREEDRQGRVGEEEVSSSGATLADHAHIFQMHPPNQSDSIYNNWAFWQPRSWRPFMSKTATSFRNHFGKELELHRLRKTENRAFEKSTLRCLNRSANPAVFLLRLNSLKRAYEYPAHFHRRRNGLRSSERQLSGQPVALGHFSHGDTTVRSKKEK